MKKLLLVAALMGACGGSDDAAPEDTTIVGIYDTPTEVVAFYASHSYVVCKHAGECVAAGRYAYDRAAEQLSLTDSSTNLTTTMPAHLAKESTIAPRDFLTPGGPLLTNAGSKLLDMNGQALLAMPTAILCRQDPVNILLDPSKLQPGEQVFDDIQAAMDKIVSPLLACRSD